MICRLICLAKQKGRQIIPLRTSSLAVTADKSSTAEGNKSRSIISDPSCFKTRGRSFCFTRFCCLVSAKMKQKDRPRVPMKQKDRPSVPLCSKKHRRTVPLCFFGYWQRFSSASNSEISCLNISDTGRIS